MGSFSPKRLPLNSLSTSIAGRGGVFQGLAVLRHLTNNEALSSGQEENLMAVYSPCPWCGTDVTPTPPLARARRVIPNPGQAVRRGGAFSAACESVREVLSAAAR